MKVIEAKTPQAAIGFEGEDSRIDSRYVAFPLTLQGMII
jgi:hypothetical protein